MGATGVVPLDVPAFPAGIGGSSGIVGGSGATGGAPGGVPVPSAVPTSPGAVQIWVPTTAKRSSRRRWAALGASVGRGRRTAGG